MYYSFSTLVALALAASPIIQAINSELSFGWDGKVSPNTLNVPNFSMSGEGNVPQIFSNKVVLTPPYGSNKRGALWGEKQNTLKEWTLNTEFRVGAVERGNGRLQFWYTKDGDKSVGTSDIYSVERFDGLALVVDTVQGIQKIRGFLNDASTDYKHHPNVDSLAFGHCDYNYRNTADPSRLEVRLTNDGFEVSINDKRCFASNKITLPIGYHFGMTANSGDPPDEFTVFKFTVAAATSTGDPSGQPEKSEPYRPVQSSPGPPPKQYQHPDARPPNIENDYHPASFYTTTETQFADLHNRLNLVSKAITNLFGEITKHTKAEEQRYEEILRAIPNPDSLSSLDNRVAKLDRMIANLEQQLRESDHSGNFAKLSEQIAQTHVGVTEHVTHRLREYVQAHTPRIGFILYSFMFFQTCCIGIFAWSKYRKSTMPKKYL